MITVDNRCKNLDSIISEEELTINKIIYYNLQYLLLIRIITKTFLYLYLNTIYILTPYIII